LRAQSATTQVRALLAGTVRELMKLHCLVGIAVIERVAEDRGLDGEGELTQPSGRSRA